MTLGQQRDRDDHEQGGGFAREFDRMITRGQEREREDLQRIIGIIQTAQVNDDGGLDVGHGDREQRQPDQ